jgi:hypothetical protein
VYEKETSGAEYRSPATLDVKVTVGDAEIGVARPSL